MFQRVAVRGVFVVLVGAGAKGEIPHSTSSGQAIRQAQGRLSADLGMTNDGRVGGWLLHPGGGSTRSSERLRPGSPRTGWAGGEDCAEDGRVGDAATGKGRVERAEELERTGSRRPIGDAAPTRERMRRGGG